MDAVIGSHWSLQSGRASCLAGVELLRNEILALGDSRDWAGDLVIGRRPARGAIVGVPLWGCQRGGAFVMGLASRSQITPPYAP